MEPVHVQGTHMVSADMTTVHILVGATIVGLVAIISVIVAVIVVVANRMKRPRE